MKERAEEAEKAIESIKKQLEEKAHLLEADKKAVEESNKRQAKTEKKSLEMVG